MKRSEQLHECLVEIMNETGQNIFDAALDFCETHDIEIDELVKQCDSSIVDRIKQCAISENMIRRSVIGEPECELNLE